MKRKHRLLLACDSIINLLLGILLLLFPAGVLDFFGLPPTNTFFYPTILGGVILGIGIALGVELFFFPKIRGLGLAGAITINFSGGLVLLYWLLFAHPDIPLKGNIILWIVAFFVLGIGIIEVATKSWRMD
jgi:hypothetical protein